MVYKKQTSLPHVILNIVKCLQLINIIIILILKIRKWDLVRLGSLFKLRVNQE